MNRREQNQMRELEDQARHWRQRATEAERELASLRSTQCVCRHCGETIPRVCKGETR